MKCDNCGHDCLEVVGTIRERDSRIGDYAIHNATYFECISCNERFYPLATARRLDEIRSEVLSILIRKRPISDFISAVETADFLGVTRQALHKHKRVRKGFIYQTELSGKLVYLRQSVELFKKTGDGRFPLSSPLYEESEAKYHFVPVRTMMPQSHGFCCGPDLKIWSHSVTDTSMTQGLSPKAEKSEFVYPLVPRQSAAVVCERKDAEYA